VSLSDNDILELTELCNALVDETITERQKARLDAWLSTSEAARQFHVRFAGQSASLYYCAGEMQTDAADTAPQATKPFNRFRWAVGLLSMAALVGLVFWTLRERPGTVHPATPPEVSAVNDEEFVGRLTGSRECAWADGASPVHPGGRLRKGQPLRLAKGFAEITFDSGALVILQGPASLDVNSAWSAKLNSGLLRASVPPEAIGFSITNPHVDVVDLGTEFTMSADEVGTSADVFVLKGEVETTPRLPVALDPEKIVLREREARRFGASGVSTVNGGEANFGELTDDVQLDRYLPPVGYARWSFDEGKEPREGVFDVDASDARLGASAIRVQGRGKATAGALRTDGRVNRALRFDGTRYAKAAFPRISENVPNTVAFWVRVPPDASLSTAYAMVAWGADSKRFGTHPFHIGWNRNPNEGLVGALRTDYGRGYALGATPLRDGRWHHVAVVLIPRDNVDSPMEVKQYVDGRLDGEGRPSPSGSDAFYSMQNTGGSTGGTIWLGCRLGIRGVRADRFFGDMDELVIANRALEPQEIVRLMTSNGFGV
jgi:hypothetical protein